MDIENINLELKCEYTKTIIAFANSLTPASWEQIRSIIKQTDGDKYELLRSFEQDLTFVFAKEEFNRRNTPFDESKYTTLGIMKTDKTYSNLGLLISDQCQHSVKIAVFDGIEKKTFKDRKEFHGSLLKQLHDVFDYLELTNRTIATFSGLDRIDERDYSQSVIREALVNSIVHRDYSFSGSIIINVYDNKMEFISLGGLVGGLSVEDIKVGISQTRNEKLANIFFRLKHIETYGYGLPNIFNDYEGLNIKPEIKITENAFVITIPNKNFYYEASDNGHHLVKESRILTEHQKAIFEYTSAHGSITRAEIERLLDVKQSRSYQILNEMLSTGFLAKSQKDKKKYVLAK